MNSDTWDLTRASGLRDRRDAHSFIALAASRDPGAFIGFLDQCTRRDLEALAALLACWYRDRAADQLCRDEGLSRDDALERVKERQRVLAYEAEQELGEE